MRSLAVLSLMFALTASPLYAQGRRNAQGIPPGQLPPAGMCRVWYDGVPPGRQPRATSCNEAERIASRDRNARVIYGDEYYRNDRYNNERYNNDRYNDRYGNTYPNRNYGYATPAYDNGYRDGLEKGREDTDRRNSFDPVRHKEYRNADRGYNNRYGSKDQYKLTYRDGFEAGYQAAYRGSRTSLNRRPF
jgi:hypothetical protein